MDYVVVYVKRAKKKGCPYALVQEIDLYHKTLFNHVHMWVWLYWCFTSHATIFQSYMWRHRCAGGLKKKLHLRSGSQRHRHFAGFFNVPVIHRHGTTLFKRRFRHTAPFSRLLRHAGDTEDVISTLTPGVLTGVSSVSPSPKKKEDEIEFQTKAESKSKMAASVSWTSFSFNNYWSVLNRSLILGLFKVAMAFGMIFDFPLFGLFMNSFLSLL